MFLLALVGYRLSSRNAKLQAKLYRQVSLYRPLIRSLYEDKTTTPSSFLFLFYLWLHNQKLLDPQNAYKQFIGRCAFWTDTSGIS